MGTTPALPELRLRPREPEFRADPYPTYAGMREREPVWWQADLEGWVVTRHADVVSALRDRRLGHAEPSVEALEGDATSRPEDPLLKVSIEAAQISRRWLILRNPPDQMRLRRCLRDAFTPAAAGGLRPRISAIAEALIARAETRGDFELIGDLAYPLPLTVICDLLGVPESDRGPLRRWTADLALTIDLDPDPLSQARAWIAATELARFFAGVVADRRAEPGFAGPILEALLDAQAKGEIDERELLAQCVLVLFGGHSTTQHLIGNGALALLRHPDQLELLRADRSLIGTAVQEFLRYDSPVQVVTRTALAATELGGRAIAAGQRVHLMLAAANRDPEAFAEPDRLNVERSPNPHVAFGSGIHVCLGPHLARVVAEAAFRTLVDRLPVDGLDVADPQWEETFQLHGLKTLPVRTGGGASSNPG